MINKLTSILEKKKRIAVGLMSGTSLDGIDAALVEIEGSGEHTNVRLLAFSTLPYTDEEKRRILNLCDNQHSNVGDICEMNVYLGERMAKAASMVIQEAGLRSREVDFISSHGQTIYHMPEKAATLQIGELAVIAANTACLTVGDFRPGDLAVGGQGAPLVPYVDFILFKSEHEGRALINIGGISNITVLRAGASAQEVEAYDMGPGNMLIDAMVGIGSNGRLSFDPDGEISASGQIDNSWLEQLLAEDEFLSMAPPKSTGREYYSMERAKALYEEGLRKGRSFEDIIATMTAYTSRAIMLQFEKFIDCRYDIAEVFVGGGGVHNKTLMQQLSTGLDRKVCSMEELGFSADAKEAIAFAILGNEFLEGRANNLPSATGARRSISMGKLVL